MNTAEFGGRLGQTPTASLASCPVEPFLSLSKERLAQLPSAKYSAACNDVVYLQTEIIRRACFWSNLGRRNFYRFRVQIGTAVLLDF
jgi:hypothetical protein